MVFAFRLRVQTSLHDLCARGAPLLNIVYSGVPPTEPYHPPSDRPLGLLPMPYTSPINVITPILKFEIFYKHAPCSIGLQARFDYRLCCFEYCTLNSMPINVWQPTGLCQDLSVIMRNACSSFEALTSSCETVIRESRLSEWYPDHHLINMPGPVPAVVKARKTL